MGGWIGAGAETMSSETSCATWPKCRGNGSSWLPHRESHRSARAVLQLLPLPRHFGQVAQLVSEDMVSAPCGPDPATHADAVRAYTKAGFDEVYIGQVGGEAEGFFEFYAAQVLPRLRGG